MASEHAAQMKLDDRLVTGYVAAQREVASFLQRAGLAPGEEPDAGAQAQLDALVKRHGFTGFSAFDDVAYNVSLVLGGLDPQTGTFGDPTAALRHEITEVTADRAIPAGEKQQMLAEMREALAAMPRTLEFPGNVEVVKRHLAAIEAALQ